MSSQPAAVSLAEAERPFFVGVDLGGTNIKVGMVSDSGQKLGYLTVPTKVELGPEAGAKTMGQAVRQVIAAAGAQPSDVGRVGLGTPGTMDIARGVLMHPVNLPGWNEFPIRDRVSQHCGLPVTYNNDGNAAAYGEHWLGAGSKFHSSILLTLGTGIGCGIIVGSLAIDGEHSHGAECGHIIVDSRDDARRCGCGHTGHLEAYSSATGVVKRTQEAIDAGRRSTLADRLAAGDELTPLMVGEEAAKGDRLALDIVLETARYLGIGIVTLMHTIDPDCVLLGGAMTFGGRDHSLGRQFLERVRAEVKRRALPIPAAETVVDFATLGGDAGYLGAAGLARAEYRAAGSRPA